MVQSTDLQAEFTIKISSHKKRKIKYSGKVSVTMEIKLSEEKVILLVLMKCRPIDNNKLTDRNWKEWMKPNDCTLICNQNKLQT